MVDAIVEMMVIRYLWQWIKMRCLWITFTWRA